MIRIFRDIGLIFLVLIFSSLCTFLWATKGILSAGPRKAKTEIPVTYNIGWWTEQKALIVNSLELKVIDSKLSMFNSKSLISYKVSGQLTYKGHWQPGINEVHISERLNKDTTLPFDRIIEITPIVTVKENKKSDGVIDNFEFTNEHIINSNHWGINSIKFICGQMDTIIYLRQSK